MRVARKTYERVREAVDAASETRRYTKIFRRHAAYTMVHRDAYVANLKLIDDWSRRASLGKGCIVECGTWLGGMSFGMIDICPQVEEFHCFDSFAGLPEVSPLDGELPRQLQQQGKFVATNNHAGIEDFRRGLARFKPVVQAKVHVHKGWFEDTLPGFAPERPIDILRLDCDWYESVTLALETLFDRVATHGLIIIDDYMTWDGCTRAVHDFLSRRRATERIQQAWPGSVSYIVKDYAPMRPYFEKLLAGERNG
jgi:O-methyltransferase